MDPYWILNVVTGHAWSACRGEAMLYTTGDMDMNYSVYRRGGSMMTLTMSDILADR